ncbi:MAG: 50S ribosomal protein L6 [Myxococcota bacterium]|nr:50S ribosomal protein L6 [Myxococcota bacterium]MDW8363234.1 50S ribosomal protein L6 [Myxococcales bacterium]
MTSAAPSRTVKPSRIGKLPVPLPAGVRVSVAGDRVSVEGPRGRVTREVPGAVAVEVRDGALHVTLRPQAGPDGTRLHGLTRALLAAAVRGVSEGYRTSLDLRGVGYRAEVRGQELTLALGFSHPVRHRIDDGVRASVEIIDEGGTKRPRLHLESHDKELLGRVAARIRAYRPPEPYKGKGVRYVDEKVRQKAASKTAGKGK